MLGHYVSRTSPNSDDAGGGGGGGGGEDEEGRVYVWKGYHGDTAIPQRLHVPCGVVQVAVGGMGHVAMVTESGRLFMYGDNAHGQLGVSGEEGAMTMEGPVLVDSLTGRYSHFTTKLPPTRVFQSQHNLNCGFYHMCGIKTRLSLHLGHVSSKNSPHALRYPKTSRVF